MSDKGNTIGRLYGATPMSDVPAADANPPIVAETPEEAVWMARIHSGLDALGAIPEVGAVFDGANALVYAVEGNAAQAAISGGATVLDLVPGVGTAGKLAEFGVKGAAKLAAKDAAEQTAKHEAEHLAEQETKHVAEQEAKNAEKAAEKKTAGTGKPGKDGAKIIGPKVRQTGARQIVDPNSIKGYDKAEEIYDAIRADSSDVAKIAKNTGLPEYKISRIKQHVFENEHQLDSGVRRFDADPDMANSWNRLTEGDFVKSDIDLLNHEYFESKFESIFDTDYRAAHSAAIESGRTWIPE